MNNSLQSNTLLYCRKVNYSHSSSKLSIHLSYLSFIPLDYYYLSQVSFLRDACGFSLCRLIKTGDSFYLLNHCHHAIVHWSMIISSYYDHHHSIKISPHGSLMAQSSSLTCY